MSLLFATAKERSAYVDEHPGELLLCRCCGERKPLRSMVKGCRHTRNGEQHTVTTRCWDCAKDHKRQSTPTALIPYRFASKQERNSWMQSNHEIFKCRCCGEHKRAIDFKVRTMTYYRATDTRKVWCFDNFCQQCASQNTRERLCNERSSIEGALRLRLLKVRQRCRKNRLECDLTVPGLLELWHTQQGRCFYSDRVLLTSNVSSPHSCQEEFTIDRLDPTRGYTLNNVVFCCWQVNIMKASMYLPDFAALVRDVAQEMPQWLKLKQNMAI